MKTLKTILWIQLILACVTPVSSVYGQYYEQGQWVDFNFFGSHTGPLVDPTVWDTSGCSWSFDDFRAAYYLGMDSPGEYIQLWFDWTPVDDLVGPCWLELYCGWSGICDTCWINIYLNDSLVVDSYGFFNGWDWQTMPHDFASQLHPGLSSDDVKIEFVGGFGTCFEIIRMNVTDVVFLHDVGVDSITSPPDTVEPGSVHYPAGLVKNFGNQIESFDAECQIDSSGVVIYVDTISVEGLMPDSTREGVFMSWTVPDAEGVTYRTCIWTLSVFDQVPENDTLCRITTVVTEAGEGGAVQEAGFTLEQNRPNPFSRKTVISYEVPSECSICLALYDVTGRVIATLVDGMVRAGQHTVSWNAEDAEPGVYFCRLNSGGQTITRKMVVLE